MGAVAGFVSLIMMVGFVVAVAVRGRRKLGLLICASAFCTLAFFIFPAQDRIAVASGYEGSADFAAAKTAGFTDPDKWATQRAKLKAEKTRHNAEAERSRREAAAAQDAAERQAKAEERRKGFHCLSAWDGSLRDFKREVKDTMRNPSSFEHIETRITPADANGTHRLSMRFRAENGFGGMNVASAVAIVFQANCSYVVVGID